MNGEWVIAICFIVVFGFLFGGYAYVAHENASVERVCIAQHGQWKSSSSDVGIGHCNLPSKETP